jgi:hypothetical protein
LYRHDKQSPVSGCAIYALWKIEATYSRGSVAEPLELGLSLGASAHVVNLVVTKNDVRVAVLALVDIGVGDGEQNLKRARDTVRYMTKFVQIG